jgi:hypothetical protein
MLWLGRVRLKMRPFSALPDAKFEVEALLFGYTAYCSPISLI